MRPDAVAMCHSELIPGDVERTVKDAEAVDVAARGLSAAMYS
jgi:hypothetical protein